MREKSHLQQFSLQGIAKLTDVIDHEWHKRSKISAARFRGTVLPHLFSDFPRLEVFPVPVQRMISDEIMAAKNSLREGLDPPKEPDNVVKWSCKFFRKYQLTVPATSLFQHSPCGSLTHQDFDWWAFLWEAGAFELDEGITSDVRFTLVFFF